MEKMDSLIKIPFEDWVKLRLTVATQVLAGYSPVLGRASKITKEAREDICVDALDWADSLLEISGISKLPPERQK